MIKITERGRKLSESDIALLQDGCEIDLPDDYRQFLIDNNGGRPSPDIADVHGLKGSPTDVQVFFGVGLAVEASNVGWWLDLLRARFPTRKILPIACDSGGNLFCITDSKAVKYCDMTDPEGTLYEVAPSFNAFLHQIRRWD